MECGKSKGFHKVESPGMQMRKEPSSRPLPARKPRAEKGNNYFGVSAAAKPQQKPQTPKKASDFVKTVWEIERK
jgi:hypothetical protein